MNTIVIGTINHSYWSYVHQLNAIERGPHIVLGQRIPCYPPGIKQIKQIKKIKQIKHSKWEIHGLMGGW